MFCIIILLHIKLPRKEVQQIPRSVEGDPDVTQAFMNQIRPPSIRAKTHIVSRFLTTSSNNMIQQHASDIEKNKQPLPFIIIIH